MHDRIILGSFVCVVGDSAAFRLWLFKFCKHVRSCKMPKIKRSKAAQGISKVPLEQQLEDHQFAKPKNRNKIRLRKDDEEKVSVL